MLWRRLVAAALLGLVLGAPAAGSESAAWTALQEGAIVLFRHANAPGGGDPAGLRIGDCSTQRNLDQSGRAQARRIGEVFRARAIAVDAVLSSQWCRSMETARLAFGASVREEPIFNSFFNDRGKGPGQTAAAIDLMTRKTGAGALVIVSHQVNITAITGVFPASGEGIVVEMKDGRARIVGRILP